MSDIRFKAGNPVLNHFPYAVLLQCITQKICHDLATPVGAIRLGLENLPENEFTPLLMESIENATCRIEMFRTFFSQQTEHLDGEKVARLLSAYLKTKAITCTSEGHTTGQSAQMLLGLGVVASECLPRGGMMHIDFDHDEVLCQGTILHMPFGEFSTESLLKENMQFKSGIILFHVMHMAEGQNITLRAHQDQNTLSFRFDRNQIA